MTALKHPARSAVIILGALATLGLVSCGQTEPPTAGGPLEMRRLTEDQYRQSVADVFGPTIQVSGQFEPEIRTKGLLAIGRSAVTVTRAGYEQYDALARSVAVQVMDAKHRDVSIPCKPTSAHAADEACAGQFVRQVGRLLFRRPLGDDEVKIWVDSANAATKISNDFYSGLEVSLAGMLVAPLISCSRSIAPSPIRRIPEASA